MVLPKDSKKSNMKAVAECAHVSISTVSHVINKTRNVNKETNDRVLEAIEKLNYTPNIFARGLRGKKIRVIGVIISDIRESFFSEVVKAIELTAYGEGYSLILCDSEDDPLKEQLYINILLQNGIEGVIFAPVNNSTNAYNSIIPHKIQAIQIDRKIDSLPIDFVGIDNVEITKKAMNHLFSHGFMNVGFVSYQANVYTMEQRLLGYKLAVQLHNSSKKINVKFIQYNGSDNKEIIKSWLYQNKEIDSILCGNDNIGYQVLRAIKELHYEVPKNIGILSFDDSKWFKLYTPPITAIRQPTKQIGRLATELLIAEMQNKIKNYSRKENHILNAELIIRKSCRENGE
ncbi:MAG TPA: LacI family transcriptional regulator [Candidatus Atribacteria bacterium]|nr:LacI family transcriptional regulator [Candidatus Atribacteria bacterium]